MNKGWRIFVRIGAVSLALALTTITPARAITIDFLTDTLVIGPTEHGGSKVDTLPLFNPDDFNTADSSAVLTGVSLAVNGMLANSGGAKNTDPSASHTFILGSDLTTAFVVDALDGTVGPPIDNLIERLSASETITVDHATQTPHFILPSFNSFSASHATAGQGTPGDIAGFSALGGGTFEVKTLLHVFRSGGFNNRGKVEWTGAYKVSYDYDVVPKASAVPEPATLTLLGLGLVGLRLKRRRKA